MKIKKFTVVLFLVALWIVSAIAVSRFLGGKLPAANIERQATSQTQKIVDEESVVIDVVEKVSPSVVSFYH